ncbi:sensor histidine kinase [Longispora fulva]|uniref:histidine kinase n=1 Tax=Longispora fulva TaxID=619741 RepID=A0A8J7GMF4_9ACTN|nr:histidine kinase [Longispora fulva]MBG6134293.1 signal transduction histidine kinase [Longispora fulva]
MGGSADLLWRPWRTVAGHPRVFDAVVATIFAGTALLAVTAGSDRNPRTPATYVTIALACGLLVCRRRWPLAVLALTTVAAVTFTALDGARNILQAAVVIAVYTVASVTSRFTAWLAGGAAGLLLYAASVRWAGHGWLDPENVAILAWTGMATAVGDATRTRRAYLAAVEERARRAEENREQEASRQVTDERLRIARELHDVVAHNIAMISVQAGVAAHVLRAEPRQAEEALGHIRQAARSVLEELSTLLGVLRQPGDPDAPTEPAPGLGRLADLLGTLATAGLRVSYQQAGQARPLPPTVDLAAYRIIQEALTNAHKHGDGRGARLSVEYTTAALVVEVHNFVPARPTPGHNGTGHGLVGMRERALTVNGTLRADHAVNGEFVLRARLPLPGDDA